MTLLKWTTFIFWAWVVLWIPWLFETCPCTPGGAGPHPECRNNFVWELGRGCLHWQLGVESRGRP
jgi:hypothetical protein